jgi:hypothetical protein
MTSVVEEPSRLHLQYFSAKGESSAINIVPFFVLIRLICYTFKTNFLTKRLNGILFEQRHPCHDYVL